jgi:hypothetical protein
VLVAGKTVKRDGAPVPVDLPAVLECAEQSAAEVLARVRAVSPGLPPRPGRGFDLQAIACAAELVRDLAGAGLAIR